MYVPISIMIENLDILDYILETCKQGVEYYMIKHDFFEEDKTVYHSYIELEDFIIWLDNHAPYDKYSVTDIRIHDQLVIVFYK